MSGTGEEEREMERKEEGGEERETGGGCLFFSLGELREGWSCRSVRVPGAVFAHPLNGFERVEPSIFLSSRFRGEPQEGRTGPA